MAHSRPLLILIILGCLAIGAPAAAPSSKAEYLELRQDILDKVSGMAFDGSMSLTQIEATLDEKLRNARDDYIRTARHAHTFEPHKYFYEWDLEELHGSQLWKVMSSLPKGSALHLHSGSSGSVDWIVEEGIYMDGGHVYWEDDDLTRCIEPIGGQEVECGSSGTAAPLIKGTMAFYPSNVTVPKGFYCAKSLDSSSSSSRDSGSDFRKQLRSLLTSNESLKDMDSSQAWEFFNKIFVRVGPVMSFRPFYFSYLINTFQVHWDDNVQHIEIRSLVGTNGLGDLFDFSADGIRVYSGDDVVDTYRKALKQFQADVTPFFTMKLIISSLRVLDPETIEGDVQEAVDLFTRHRDLIIGFDLVAEEDPNHRTLDYLDVWMELLKHEERLGLELPLYFHDGESNDRNNTNMIDAVMLGSKRIGHGINSYFFPALFDQMREQGIVLEVNPISNQVLRYVDNLELHPVNGFLAEGINVVIAADDPGAFGYTGLSYDWWAALVAFQLDLRSLKQLCNNSLEFSGLEGEELEAARGRWQTGWDAWVERWDSELS
ncbi:hypothetical protein TrVE_jg968 [Triparma verrucosa]|uniref:adenosine deaminase n=1 Tax=Triparma verrucosa TaxID=1606542 RepID=A0A9W7FIR2_9STRA|nr:hypothetical protein TrVE_jg968 [Triparma verrucosa]